MRYLVEWYWMDPKGVPQRGAFLAYFPEEAVTTVSNLMNSDPPACEIKINRVVDNYPDPTYPDSNKK